MSDRVYKRLDPERDVLYVQKVETEQLFYPKTAVHKPYNSSNGYEIEETVTPETFPSNFNPVRYLKDLNSKVKFLAYARATKEGFDGGESTTTGMLYHNIKNILHPNESIFAIDDGNVQTETTEFDVISVTREWYKDSINPNFFAVFIHSGSSTPTSTPSGYSSGDGIIGLYPSKKKFSSPVGEKRYLYPTTSSDTLYNTTTDELVMKTDDDLNKDTPYGEILLETGMIILYTDIISAQAGVSPTTTTALHYVAGVAGTSRIQINSTLFFARLFNEEFNYSTNRTFYRDDAENVIRPEFRDNPTTYITSVGFYNDRNQLIAFGRLSTPVKKTFTNERYITAELSL